MLTVEKIKELIKSPKNQKSLLEARENERVLEFLFYDRHREEKFFSKLTSLLVPDRIEYCRSIYENHCTSILDKIPSHLSKIFEAQGKLFKYRFKDLNTEIKFSQWSEGSYEGISPLQFWSNKGLQYLLCHPTSIVISDIIADVPKNKVYTCSHIVDIDADAQGIKYAILKFNIDSGDQIITADQKAVDVTVKYFAFDEANYYVLSQAGDEIIIDKQIPHKAKECPIEWLYDVNLYPDNHVIKKSIVWDSRGDLMDYLRSRNFQKMYKYDTGHPTIIEPEIEEVEFSNPAVQDGDYETTPGGNGGFAGALIAATNQRKPNIKTRSGRRILIPQQNFNPDVLKHLIDSFKTLEGNSEVLNYLWTDCEQLEEKILCDIIGSGYGATEEIAGKTATEVHAGTETQESVLTFIKSKIETSWQGSFRKCANLGFVGLVSITINLGDKFFLKSDEKLSAELKGMSEAGFPFADLAHKRNEVIYTQYKHDVDFLERRRILNAIQPFTQFTKTEVLGMAQTLVQSPANLDFYLYLHFDELVNRFEIEEGSIAVFGVEMENYNKRIKLIKDKLITYLNEKLAYGREQQPAQSSGGSEEINGESR